MNPQSYREKWQDCRNQGNTAQAQHLPKQIALSFLDHHYYNNQYRTDYIDLLCEMALCSRNPDYQYTASSALFGIIVEGLCDDFDEWRTEIYNRVISQVISFYRKTEHGQQVDTELKKFGLHTFDDVFRRIESIRATSDEPKNAQLGYPEKIIVLSRVTLGADVAITSVIVQYFQVLFPESEIVLLGGEKLHGLFGGNRNLKIRHLNYSRRGTLAERLHSWLYLRDTVKSEIGRSPAEKIVLVDPDSRLTQLGVLPLVEKSPSLFFDSRGKSIHPRHLTMAELANHWLNNVFSRSELFYPQVWIEENIMQRARNYVKAIRSIGARRIITVNFGVGGNERKRLSIEAEIKLITDLLKTPGTVVVLDKGAGETEQERIESIVKDVADHGEIVADCHFARIEQAHHFAHGLISISAGIGEMGALISCSDEYIGYDSACQHIAAALGIPTCTVFAGTNDPDFVRRWRATGPGRTRLVHVDTLTTPAMFNADDIVARIIHARSEDFQT